MSLSILTNIDRETKYLYDSDTQTVIMVGNEEDVSAWKHCVEDAQQKVSNEAHFDLMRKEYTERLVKAGNSPEAAEAFLREKMPFLFKDNIKTTL